MPRDMAMKRPDAGVVEAVLHYEVPTCAHELHVSTLRVVGVDDATAVPVTCAFGQDLHVVTVQMHWVRSWGGVVDHDTHGGIGAEVLDVPFIRIGEVTLLGKQKNGVVVVYTRRGAVESPEEATSCVDYVVDDHGLRR